MIVYSSLTVGDIIAMVLDQVGQFRTALNLDVQTVWNFLSHSRREAMSRVLPFTTDTFMESATMQNAQPFPLGYVRTIRVLKIKEDNTGTEARYADPREWWRITNATIPHSFNRSSNEYPVYTVFGPITGNSYTLSSGQTPNQQAVHFYASPSDGDYYVEYVRAYQGLPVVPPNNDPDLNAVIGVPYEMENLIIDGTVMRCYFRIGESKRFVFLYGEIKKEIARLRKYFAAQMQAEALLFESLPDMQPAQVETTTIQQQSR